MSVEFDGELRRNGPSGAALPRRKPSCREANSVGHAVGAGRRWLPQGAIASIPTRQKRTRLYGRVGRSRDRGRHVQVKWMAGAMCTIYGGYTWFLEVASDSLCYPQPSRIHTARREWPIRHVDAICHPSSYSTVSAARARDSSSWALLRRISNGRD